MPTITGSRGARGILLVRPLYKSRPRARQRRRTIAERAPEPSLEENAMHLGLTIFPTDYSIPLPELALEAEQRGFESLWVAEHSHIPTSRKSPWPGGGDLPKMYYDTLDPFVALSAAAAVTSRIKLATGICLVVQRDPIHTAKQVASLDRISHGRFLFGVGGGWNEEEMNNHGTAFEGRFALLRERVEAMVAIWTHDEAEYHGRTGASVRSSM